MKYTVELEWLWPALSYHQSLNSPRITPSLVMFVTDNRLHSITISIEFKGNYEVPLASREFYARFNRFFNNYSKLLIHFTEMFDVRSLFNLTLTRNIHSFECRCLASTSYCCYCCLLSLRVPCLYYEEDRCNGLSERETTDVKLIV